MFARRRFRTVIPTLVAEGPEIEPGCLGLQAAGLFSRHEDDVNSCPRGPSLPQPHLDVRLFP